MITDFFRWWRAELGSVVPTWLKTSRASARTLDFEFSNSTLSVGLRRKSAYRELGVVALGEDRDSTAWRFVSSAIADLKPNKTPVTLTVPASHVLRKELKLPQAVEENLDAALSYELQRQTPFALSEIYYGADPPLRHVDGQHLSVSIWVIPHQVVADALKLIQPWNLKIAEQSALTKVDDQKYCLHLEPQDQRPGVSKRVEQFFLLINACLLVALIAVPIYRQYQSLADLRTELDEARKNAVAAADLEAIVEQQRSQSEYLLEEKRLRYTTVELLESLSTQLRDSTWVRRLEIKDGGLIIDGESDNASALIAELEVSPMFHDVKFASRVTRDARNGKERFSLSARINSKTDTPALAELQ